MNPPPLRKLAVALIVPVLAAAAAGCGDDEPEGAAPAAWTKDVCTRLGTWLDRIEQRSDDLQDEVADVASLEDARTRLVTFLDDAVTITDDLLAGFDEAGTPAVDDGAALAGDFRDGLRQARTIFADGRRRAARVPVDDEAAFQAAAEDLGEDIERAGDEVERAFEGFGDEHDAPELDRAFEEEPACDRLER